MNLSHIFHRKSSSSSSSKHSDKPHKAFASRKKSDDSQASESIQSSSDSQQNGTADSPSTSANVVSPTISNSLDDACSDSTTDPEADALLQYTPDKTKFPKSYKLTKTLVKEGSIHWSCCKCAEYNNEFKVDRADLVPENLLQPFFMWGDSFCNNCYHNFCHSCIEGHHFHHH